MVRQKVVKCVFGLADWIRIWYLIWAHNTAASDSVRTNFCQNFKIIKIVNLSSMPFIDLRSDELRIALHVARTWCQDAAFWRWTNDRSENCCSLPTSGYDYDCFPHWLLYMLNWLHYGAISHTEKERKTQYDLTLIRKYFALILIKFILIWNLL